VVVQPAFAHRHHFRLGEQRPHLRIALGGVFAGVVRMHAGGGEQEPRMGARQFQRPGRMLAAGPGDHQLGHAGSARALQDCVAIAVEGLVGEVGTDIDELHGAWSEDLGAP
jgi:hypothetical protein